MTELSRRARFTILPMFLLAGLFLGACSSGGDGASIRRHSVVWLPSHARGAARSTRLSQSVKYQC